MNNINTGGSAFPGENDHQSGASTFYSSGMTLRQYYAAKAMQGYRASGATVGNSSAEVAEMSFMDADAMINFEEQGK